MLENWQVLMSPPGSAHLALGASVNAEKYEKFCSPPSPALLGVHVSRIGGQAQEKCKPDEFAIFQGFR